MKRARVLLWLLRLLITLRFLQLFYFLMRIDLFVLDHIYQRIANFFQVHFGIICFRISDAMLTCSLVAVIGNLMIVKGHPSTSVYVAQGVLAAVLVLMYSINYLINQMQASMTRPGFLNPARRYGVPQRLMIIALNLFFALTSALTVLSRIDKICYISCLYFLACTPLPPQKSTVRKFLESLTPSPATAEATSK